jgi:hypothetical protein
VNSRPAFILWPLAVGGAGFAVGFFGPLAFNPEANQGPLLGIFITGPVSAVLGFLVCAVVRITRISPQRQWQTLLCSAAVVALGALWVLLYAGRHW